MALHLLLFNLFLKVYLAGIHLSRRWNPKAVKFIEGRRQQKHILGQSLPKDKPIMWMHCASLGEFEQGRPVLENYRKAFPEHRIVLTFFSPSGFEVRKDYNMADQVLYLPVGGEAVAREFIAYIHPQLVIWVKYDYWYHYLSILHQQEIPVLLVSAIFRKTQPFFRWYGALHRRMLGYFQHLFVQNEDSRSLLQRIQLPARITVSGDTRFDRVIEIASNPASYDAIEAFCQGRTVIVAGSTWREDEEELNHYSNLHPDICFIVAPHEIFAEHLDETEKLFHQSVRYSLFMREFMRDPDAARKLAQEANTLIIDNIGMLSSLYQYAAICYVGGGFGSDGVHNVLEAAVYGRPVIFGPEFQKYHEAIGLVSAGAAFPVGAAVELEKTFDELLNSPEKYRLSCDAARTYVYSNSGATGKIMKYISNNFREASGKSSAD